MRSVGSIGPDGRFDGRFDAVRRCTVFFAGFAIAELCPPGFFVSIAHSAADVSLAERHCVTNAPNTVRATAQTHSGTKAVHAFPVASHSAPLMVGMMMAVV